MGQYQNSISGFNHFLKIDETAKQEAEDAQFLTGVQGNIELCDVSFNYETTREALKHINLNI